MKSSRRSQLGAVSLFVVIFAALLTMVITISFIRVVVQMQERATNDDLSQSAYDSAMAGVEDAKRAIVRYRTICAQGTPENCDAARALVNSTQCNAAVSNGATSGEVLIQRNEADATSAALDQAYTCVLINTDTASYDTYIAKDDSILVPLRSVDNFSRIRLSWFTSADAGAANLNFTNVASGVVMRSTWPANRPPVMRAQLIQHGTTFTLADLDAAAQMDSGTRTGNNTLFLYPKRDSTGAQNTSRFTDDAVSTPKEVYCRNDLSAGGYACTTTLILPDVIGGTVADREAYLRLKTFYGGSSVRVELLNAAGDVINLDDVQPMIDSTGRANDLFRRVRVLVGEASFPYPDAVIGVGSSFCKNFAVTDTTYTSGASNCQP